MGVEVDIVDLDAAGYPLLREIVAHGVAVAEKRSGAVIAGIRLAPCLPRRA